MSPSRNGSIVPFTGTLEDRSRLWLDLSDDERRRKAMRAANKKDRDALWSLTETHISTHGYAGATVSPNTLRSYQRGLDLFVSFTETRGVNILRPTRDAGAAFLRHLESEGASPSTVRVRLAAARGLYRALRWAGATEVDPFADTRAAPDKTKAWDKRAPYSRSEVIALLDAAVTPTEGALVLLGAHAGLRISEAVNLRWRDVDLAAGEAKVVGKGRKVRRVVLSRSVIDALGGLQQLSEEVFAFGDQEGRRKIGQLSRRAGVPYKGYHGLRHHAGTQLYAATDSLDTVAHHLGHSSIETARVYAKWADTKLRDVMETW